MSPGDLRQAVDATLHSTMGHAPRHDSDGDIPILFGTTLVYVRVADGQPVVSIFGVVVQDIADMDAARREVELLNRQSVFAKFHLVGRQIIASVAIPCLPFVPRHLVGMVELMGKELDQLDDALAERVRGRRWIDIMTGSGSPGDPEPLGGVRQVTVGSIDAPEGPGTGSGLVDGGTPADDEAGEDELPEELMTLLQLAADDEDRLDAALVADVCHRDRTLILQLIRIAEEQTISWRESVDAARAAGDADEARVASGEMRGWESTVRDLRAALRHVVTCGRGDD